MAVILSQTVWRNLKVAAKLNYDTQGGTAMMPFTVLRRFSGSDYLLPGLEEQDRPDGNSKEEQPYFTILSTPDYPGFDFFPSAA